jgi:hypothetical protein
VQRFVIRQLDLARNVGKGGIRDSQKDFSFVLAIIVVNKFLRPKRFGELEVMLVANV